MISRNGTGFDLIIVTAEYYDDHPLSPAGIITRVLDAKGYRIGILEKPVTENDFLRLGVPLLGFCVTSGSIDSMLHNYTPLKKERILDPHGRLTPMPDRAVIVYCNTLRRLFKGSPLIIGGIEASLRRFAHYDYWDNKVRKSILLDSRADILVYGNGELQIIEIARRLRDGKALDGIEGTCILRKTLPEGFTLLPPFAEAKDDAQAFCRMQALFSNDTDLAQPYDNNFVLQYRYPRYTAADLDWIYGLPYSRRLHPKSMLNMAQFSVVTHRGCIGNCSFCSLTLHQGEKIVSRSEQSILDEIARMTKLPGFTGIVDDLGGPAANMYGMDCATRCSAHCLGCRHLDKSHDRLVRLLRKARAVPGVTKILVRSGIRYDLALNSDEYLQEISEHHISGCLKIAPEHFSEKVLKLMGKENSRFDDFLQRFTALNKERKQGLRYYFMVGHPGESEEETALLVERVRALGNAEQFQLFTPTPMTVATCMYWTGLNPFTLEPVAVVRDYNGKKRLKRMVLSAIKERRFVEDE